PRVFCRLARTSSDRLSREVALRHAGRFRVGWPARGPSQPVFGIHFSSLQARTVRGRTVRAIREFLELEKAQPLSARTADREWLLNRSLPPKQQDGTTTPAGSRPMKISRRCAKSIGRRLLGRRQSTGL